MSLKDWLERQAPDFVETWRRFPLAIILAALNTLLILAAINGLEWVEHDAWGRAAFGLATGAVLAVAGVYFAESRPDAKRWGLFLKYALPLLAIAAFQVTDIAWFVPYALPAVAILWLSVSPFTRVERGVPREEQQRRFWLINHQALATAAIAAGAFALIALGFLAIERSMSILFGLDTGWLFYRGLLPFTALFLAPVYWLSTLPRLSDVHAGEAERPEFIGKAVGFLGQFILVPLLFIYALILLAYTAQIVITRHLPEGMIGWMVMGFVIVGAATWLVLYPPFMRDKPLARLFRRLWFWLTLIPLGLFFVAVWVRVDAYGLTAERMLLLAGGIWALALAAIFLFRRGDIRIIPALAGAILLLLSVGSWNYAYLPLQHQLFRLDLLVTDAGKDKSLSPPRPDWSGEEVAELRSIVDYLGTMPEGKRATRELLGRYGISWPAEQDGSYAVLAAMGLDADEAPYEMPRYASLWRDLNTGVDVSATPYQIRPLALYGASSFDAGPIKLELSADGILRVGPPGAAAETMTATDLTAWLDRQQGETITDPWIDFAVAGRKFRLTLDSLGFDRGENGEGPRVVNSVQGQLFSDQP